MLVVFWDTFRTHLEFTCSLQHVGHPGAPHSVTVAADKIRYRIRTPVSKDTELLLVKCHLAAVNARKSFILPMAKACIHSTSGYAAF